MAGVMVVVHSGVHRGTYGPFPDQSIAYAHALEQGMSAIRLEDAREEEDAMHPVR